MNSAPRSRSFDEVARVFKAALRQDTGEVITLISELTEDQLIRVVEAVASDVWERTRALALEHYGEACLLCGRSEDLNVHHRTYESVGAERLSDLAVLCRDCHAGYHGKAA